MDPVRFLSVVPLVALPTVMVGGYSLLRQLTQGGALSALQEQLLRAGQAHAGAVLVLSLAYSLYLGRTATPGGLRWRAGAALAAGVLARLSGGPDPEAAVLAGERRAAVRAALARLPDRPRRLLTLRFYYQLSYAEIGQRTGQDTNTVGVQLLRARRRLRDELRRGGSPDGQPSGDGRAPGFGRLARGLPSSW